MNIRPYGLNNNLRGILLNYRSIAVAKGLLKTNFGGKPFCSVSYCQMANLLEGNTCFEKIDTARAYLVPVPNRALEFKIPKIWRKEGRVPYFFKNQK